MFDLIKELFSAENIALIIVIAVGIAAGTQFSRIVEFIKIASFKTISFIADKISTIRFIFGKKGRSICSGCGEQLKYCECVDSESKSVSKMFKEQNRTLSINEKAQKAQRKDAKKENKEFESTKKQNIKAVVKEEKAAEKAKKQEAKKPTPVARPTSTRRGR